MDAANQADNQQLLIRIELGEALNDYQNATTGQPLDEQRRRRFTALIIIEILALIFLGALICYLAFSFFRIPKDIVDEQRTLELWCIVWLARLGLQNLLDLTLMCCRKYGIRIHPFLFILQNTLFLVGFLWFLYGTEVLWLAKRVDGESKIRRWASIFWWYQAMSFLVPCTVYSMICLCLPCLIMALVRLQVPQRDQRPTPQSVLNRMQIKTFGELMEILGREQQREGTSNSVVPCGNVVENIFNRHRSFGLASQNGSQVGEENNRACPICMLEFESTDMVMIMPCDKRHYFHERCVYEWLKNSQACPICRANVVSCSNEMV